ncbi:hypothetical protein [Dongia sp.]|uniref:terminase small subunit-like protein n=1 Tax=Dongia sp. TaxID=1977262 RepID=UPI003752C14A
MAKAKPPKKTGRPTDFTENLATEICLRISEGESVRSIVKDEDMPSSSTIFRWLLDERYKTFWEQYEKARNIQAELMFEELLEIADDGTNDYTTRMRGADGEEEEHQILNSEHIQRSRLRVDTRKWYLSKVLPKKFGDKLDLTSKGDKFPQPLLYALRDNDRDEEDSGAQETN